MVGEELMFLTCIEKYDSLRRRSLVYKLDNYTLSEAWSKSREQYGELPFLGYAGEELITYADADRNIRSIQSFLKSRDIKRGDKVALISESRPEWGQVYLAVTTMGCTAVPVMADFSDVQMNNILEHSDSVFLFASEKVSPKLASAFLLQSGRMALIRDGIWTGRMESSEGGALRFREEENLLDPSARGEDLLCMVEEDDIAAILYTSGTTGNSKGVMLSHKNISHNAHSGIEIPGVRPGHSFLSVLPLAHSYECTLGLVLPMVGGASVHYIKGAPTARILLPALATVKPQHMLTVPLLIEKTYRSSILPKLMGKKVLKALYGFRPTQFLLNRFVVGKSLYKLFGGRLQFYGVGGAPLAPDVERFLRDARFPYSVGYGLTETSPCLAGDKPSKSVFRAIGQAYPGVSLRIADVNPDTGHGEVQAKGPTIMAGYYKDGEKTKEVFTKDGWFKTGDLGFLNKQNILYIKGRLKNMILGPNGENIYPEEIEAVLNRNPLVAESLVTRIGTTLVARVQLNTERLDELYKEFKHSCSEEELRRRKEELLEKIRQTANDSLSALSRLGQMIEQVEPFEKTPSLKIKRFLYT